MLLEKLFAYDIYIFIVRKEKNISGGFDLKEKHLLLYINLLLRLFYKID